MSDRRFAAFALGVWLAAPAFGAATVELERPFGYLVGDIVTQRVTFDHLHGKIDRASLPRPGYQTPWLFLRSAQLEGSDNEQRLTLEYQVMSSADGVTLIHLPAVTVKTSLGSDRIDAVPISVSALTRQNPIQVQGMGDLRPDRLLELPDKRLFSNRLWWALPLLALLGLALWLRTRWLNNAGPMLPFTQARRQIRELSAHDPKEPQAPLRHAHQLLHRAFDLSAGRRLFAEDIGDYINRVPAFGKAHDEISGFFESSSQLFFGGESDSSRLLDLQAVRRLSERLAAIERGAL